MSTGTSVTPRFRASPASHHTASGGWRSSSPAIYQVVALASRRDMSKTLIWAPYVDFSRSRHSMKMIAQSMVLTNFGICCVRIHLTFCLHRLGLCFPHFLEGHVYQVTASVRFRGWYNDHQCPILRPETTSLANACGFQSPFITWHCTLALDKLDLERSEASPMRTKCSITYREKPH